MAAWASLVFFMALLSLAACTWQNVALNKPAWMSTMLTDGNVPASNAVDGVTIADMFAYLMHTNVDERTAWWKVFLQREVRSAQVKIFFRADYKKRRKGVQLYTSVTDSPDPKGGSLCHTVTGLPDGTNIPDVLNVTCPGTWRSLTVYTETDNDGRGAVLDFAEVQVWTCTSGYYETNCGQRCGARHCKSDSSCDVIQGQCVGGCAAGYQGTDCIQDIVKVHPAMVMEHAEFNVMRDGHCTTAHKSAPTAHMASNVTPPVATVLIPTHVITSLEPVQVDVRQGGNWTGVRQLDSTCAWLQWINSSQKDVVRVKDTQEPVDRNMAQPSDNYTSLSEQAGGCNMFTNDYDAVDVEAKANRDYDVIKNKA
ncbi:uncharacterized protein [Haliotis cracherodii]|uniref:uncharacterized protein n=1 Tax=Haliotis cracherodii TaxID=6455 RepID=UPI0039EB113F